MYGVVGHRDYLFGYVCVYHLILTVHSLRHNVRICIYSVLRNWQSYTMQSQKYQEICVKYVTINPSVHHVGQQAYAKMNVYQQEMITSWMNAQLDAVVCPVHVSATLPHDVPARVSTL